AALTVLVLTVALRGAVLNETGLGAAILAALVVAVALSWVTWVVQLEGWAVAAAVCYHLAAALATWPLTDRGPAAWLHVAALNAQTSGLIALVWLMAVRRRERLTPLLGAQVSLALGWPLLLLGAAAVRIAVLPDPLPSYLSSLATGWGLFLVPG